MNNKIFSGGVDPGGLNSKQEIKVLICYILHKIGSLKKQDIIISLQETGLVNYFVAGQAFSELISGGNIFSKDKTSDEYDIKESGKIIAEQLYESVPISVREKAINAVLATIKRRKNEEENKVKIEKNNFGFNVTCSVSGGEFDLLKVNIYVPDMDQAEKVKQNFRTDPELLYRTVLSILTCNEEFELKLKNSLQNLIY